MGEIIAKDKFKEKRVRLRSEGKKVVLCHGVFDLIHPGHMIHFEEAKKLGDVLVCSVTAAKYVRKGPDRPYFSDELRLKFLSEIACIDYVMLSEGYTVDDIIEVVEPDLYVKGKEYEKSEDDITGMIDKEVALVKAHGGEVAYTSGEVFSSTRLINQALAGLSEDVKTFSVDFQKRYKMEDIRDYTEKMQKLKVLVVGDVIIDDYTFCHVQGLMSKDMGYSARYQSSERYLGGALAVAHHLSSFNDNVTLMSVVGTEENIHSRILDELGDKMRIDLVYSRKFPTIVKQRYVSINEMREEIHKIFAINNLPVPMKIDDEALDEFKRRLRERVGSYDVVILCDFGHGLIDGEVMDILQEKSRFLALNCQTNSSNYGKNLITKYRRADVFALDQRELGLAFSEYQQEEGEQLLHLAEHFHSCGWLTRGSKGAISVENGSLKECPAFVLKVKDTIGAGDAFFAVASLTAAVGAPVEVGTFMGNIAGALAANIVGNSEALQKVDVLKYASTLLNV